MTSILRQDTRVCQTSVIGGWVVMGILFVSLLFTRLGWLGPAPAFFLWSAGALPLFLLTWRWQHNIGATQRGTLRLLTLGVWVLLAGAVPIIRTPTNVMPSELQWMLMVALTGFPLVVTWYVVRLIQEHRPLVPGAA